MLLNRAFILVVYVYQAALSPFKTCACCRFTPTCSRYAIEALQTHPIHHALWLILRRIGRCHPWANAGYDPVPHAISSHTTAN